MCFPLNSLHKHGIANLFNQKIETCIFAVLFKDVLFELLDLDIADPRGHYVVVEYHIVLTQLIENHQSPIVRLFVGRIHFDGLADLF
jgi:hypothetical protein